MAKVISDDFVRLYNHDAVDLTLDNGMYIQVFYTAKFSKVKLFGVDYKVVESIDFYKIVMLDECGNVINNDNNIDYDYYKNIALNTVLNKIDSYDYQTAYKTFSKDFYNDMVTS